MSFYKSDESLPFVWLGAFLFWLLSWLLDARRLAPETQNHALYSLRLYRQTFMAMIPWYGTFWIVIAVLSLPQRRVAENELENLLRHGEVRLAMQR
jgi:hypothetical protein